MKKARKPTRQAMCEQRFRVVMDCLADSRNSDDVTDVVQVSRLWVFSKAQRTAWEQAVRNLEKRFGITWIKKPQRSLFDYDF